MTYLLRTFLAGSVLLALAACETPPPALAAPPPAPAPAPVSAQTAALYAAQPDGDLTVPAIPAQLLTEDKAHPYSATAGWASQNNSPVPGANGFQPAQGVTAVALADGQNEVQVPFVWNGPNGVSIHRTYTFKRGDYAISVKDEVVNTGAAPWQGYVFRKLDRVPPVISKGMTNPDSFSFNGATWFSPADGYQRRAFKDYLEDGTINQTISGGWVAMLQHHFFTAWIPQADQSALYLLSQNGPRNVIETRGPGFTVAPGQKVSTEARLWVGPKLVNQIAKEDVKGLDRVVDYSRFSPMAIIGQGLFWVMNQVHKLVGNWGWAIVLLTVAIKAIFFPLSAASYKSMAKMKAIAPRMTALRERCGDDKQKLNMEMMNLYKTEKINPLGGCLPIAVQIPVFIALYWALLGAVEMRDAPWILWIHDLSSQDPYYVLPVIMIATMLIQTKLNPTPPDPIQAKMMMLMPFIFGGMFLFFPSGLVLYWVVNNILSIAQQWQITRMLGSGGKAANDAKA